MDDAAILYLFKLFYISARQLGSAAVKHQKVAFCISFVDSGPYQLVHASLTVRQRFDCCNQRKRITLLWPTSSAERRILYWE